MFYYYINEHMGVFQMKTFPFLVNTDIFINLCMSHYHAFFSLTNVYMEFWFREYLNGFINLYKKEYKQKLQLNTLFYHTRYFLIDSCHTITHSKKSLNLHFGFRNHVKFNQKYFT